MEEAIKKYKEYLLKQKDLTKSWIKEQLDKDNDTKTLNSRLQFINGAIEVFNYTFKDYLPKEELSISNSDNSEELPF